jgi:cell wall-associated NlpC family hydrolase
VRRVIGVGAATVVCLAVAPGAASAAPTAPSDSQISAAQQAKADAAARVGAITAQLAEAQAGADASHYAAQIALQDYEEQQAAYEAAKAVADAAAAAAAQAAAELQGGRDDVADFARASYKQGSTSPGMNALLSSGGPTELLERAALLDAAGVHHTDVVAQLTVLEQQATTADQAAQQAVGEAEVLQAQAAETLEAAKEHEISARAQADALSAQQDAVEVELAEAQETLYGLEGARAAAAAAAEAARATRPTPTSTPSGSSSTPTVRPPSGSSSGSPSGSPAASGSGSSAPRPVGTTAGAPSGSAVQVAVAAARSQIGMAYSWGGGGSRGPSYGISPDGNVFGFDCSGLTEYAYARAGIAIGGTSREQYNRFSSKRVAVGDLKPGDLLFWDNGSGSTSYQSIVHVALYIGGNQMIEAPDRGQKVRVSTARTSSSTYFGAVRPAA